MKFWDIFGDDFRKNCLAWRHHPDNPVIRGNEHDWDKVYTASPDYLKYRNRNLLYYRGSGRINDEEQLHERIAVSEILSISPDGIELSPLNEDGFILNIGKKGDFDDQHVLDPATIAIDNTVLMYYSAVSYKNPDSIGLAKSDDGVRFEKIRWIAHGKSPEVIYHDNKIYLLLQIYDDQRNNFHLLVSEDGLNFRPVQNEPVFRVEKDSWDQRDITTGRVFRQEGIYYLLYGGSTYPVDQPDYFGLARSNDLVHWERHPGNPLFGCGAKGTEDGGAIWFPALFETETHYILLYEGSRGKINWQLSSRICLASIPKKPVQ